MGDLYHNPSSRIGVIIEEGVERRQESEVGNYKETCFFFWTLQGSCTYKLKRVVTACIKHVKTQGRQNYNLCRGGGWSPIHNWGAIGSWRLLGKGEGELFSLMVWTLVDWQHSSDSLYEKERGERERERERERKREREREGGRGRDKI